MFSEIVINKYFLLATHFISKLPKKLPFSAKSSFTYCWYKFFRIFLNLYSCLLVIWEWEKLASTPKFDKKCNCGTPYCGSVFIAYGMDPDPAPAFKKLIWCRILRLRTLHLPKNTWNGFLHHFLRYRELLQSYCTFHGKKKMWNE